METRVAGLFAFWPLLVQLGFDELVRQADYPGSDMVPAAWALLSLLTLKLLDKERRSHISDFNFDEATGLFAGLNIPQEVVRHRLFLSHRPRQPTPAAGGLGPGLRRGSSRPPVPSRSTSTPIPFRGDPTGLDRHYLPLRGRAGTSVLTFFARSRKAGLLCYSDADLTRAEPAGKLLGSSSSGRSTGTDPTGSTSIRGWRPTRRCRGSTTAEDLVRDHPPPGRRLLRGLAACRPGHGAGRDRHTEPTPPADPLSR